MRMAETVPNGPILFRRSQLLLLLLLLLQPISLPIPFPVLLRFPRCFKTGASTADDFRLLDANTDRRNRSDTPTNLSR